LRGDGFDVYGTSRSAEGRAGMVASGVKAIDANYVTAEGVTKALKESQASFVFFLTDFWTAAGGSKSKEIEQGQVIIDAIKAAAPHVFVVFASGVDADSAPLESARSKVLIEANLRASGLRFAILRPVAFFENLDDAANWNALTKGKVKFLVPADVAVQFVSTVDIGKAAAFMFKHPHIWSGKTLDCTGQKISGTGLAAALSRAPGVQCEYAEVLPECVMRMFMKDLFAMEFFFEDIGCSSDPAKFKQVVPDAMDAEAWFRYKGQWANGEKFGAPDAAPAASFCGF